MVEHIYSTNLVSELWWQKQNSRAVIAIKVKCLINHDVNLRSYHPALPWTFNWLSNFKSTYRFCTTSGQVNNMFFPSAVRPVRHTSQHRHPLLALLQSHSPLACHPSPLREQLSRHTSLLFSGIKTSYTQTNTLQNTLHAPRVRIDGLRVCSVAKMIGSHSAVVVTMTTARHSSPGQSGMWKDSEGERDRGRERGKKMLIVNKPLRSS